MFPYTFVCFVKPLSELALGDHKDTTYGIPPLRLLWSRTVLEKQQVLLEVVDLELTQGGTGSIPNTGVGIATDQVQPTPRGPADVGGTPADTIEAAAEIHTSDSHTAWPFVKQVVVPTLSQADKITLETEAGWNE